LSVIHLCDRPGDATSGWTCLSRWEQCLTLPKGNAIGAGKPLASSVKWRGRPAKVGRGCYVCEHVARRIYGPSCRWTLLTHEQRSLKEEVQDTTSRVAFVLALLARNPRRLVPRVDESE
jgi:hypothetical protein